MLSQNPNRGTQDPKGINIFTDGSKRGHRSGASVVITNNGNVSKDTEGLDKIYNYHL